MLGLHGIDLWFFNGEAVMFFAVRYEGSRELLAVIEAKTVMDLYWILDVETDPLQCQYAVLPSNGAFVADIKRWKSVSLAAAADYSRQRREASLARLENEVADLQGVFKDLNRIANDRFNRHRRRSRKDAEFVEEDRPGQDQPH